LGDHHGFYEEQTAVEVKFLQPLPLSSAHDQQVYEEGGKKKSSSFPREVAEAEGYRCLGQEIPVERA